MIRRSKLAAVSVICAGVVVALALGGPSQARVARNISVRPKVASGPAAVSPIPPGAPQPNAACASYGYLVQWIYANWSTPLPDSGTCWTTIRPLGRDIASYTNCNVSGGGSQNGTGSSWTYDDTNAAGHGGHTDSWMNTQYCHGHVAYQFELMARGPFTWEFSPTLLFEEDYDSGHLNYAYTGARTEGPYGVTGSPYNNVPTIDVYTPYRDNGGLSLTNRIKQDCYQSPIYQGVYEISIYNNVDPGAGNEASIVSALNSCYK